MTIVFSSVTETDSSCCIPPPGSCDVMDGPAAAADGGRGRPERPPRRRRPQLPATARPSPQVAPPVLRLLGPAPGRRTPAPPSQGAAPPPSLPQEGAAIGGQRLSPLQRRLETSQTVDKVVDDDSLEDPSRAPPVAQNSKTTTTETNRTVPSKPPVPPPPLLKSRRASSAEGHTRVFRTKSAPGGHQAKLSVFPLAAGTPVEVTVLRSAPDTNGAQRSPLTSQRSLDDLGGAARSPQGSASDPGRTQRSHLTGQGSVDDPGQTGPRQRQPSSTWGAQTVTWGLTPGTYSQYRTLANGHGGTYHKDSYMAHRRDWRQGLGHEGRYRRTQSPSPSAERRRPSWPVSLSPPTIARSVSYAAPSRQNMPQPQLTPLGRLPQPASTGRLTAAAAGRDDTEEWQSCSSTGSQSTVESASPAVSRSSSTVTRLCPSSSLSLPRPRPVREARPRRHHSAGNQFSTVSIEVLPPPLEEPGAESGARRRSAAEEAETPAAVVCAVVEEDDVFATPPTALPEEDPAESDTGDTPGKVDEETQTPADDDLKSAAASPPPPPPPKPSLMLLSPPPLPASSSPTRPNQRRCSAELLSPIAHPSAGVSRRPSLPVYATDRSPGHVTARSGVSSPIQLPVNGVHRPSRVAAALAWSDRHGVRQTARDLLDPRRLPEDLLDPRRLPEDLLDPQRLPEVTARRQERRDSGSTNREDSAADVSTADISWSGRPELMSAVLTVTSHQVGVGRTIPLILTTTVDPAADTTLWPSSESPVSGSDSHTAEDMRRRQTELSSHLARQLAVLREEQRAVEEEAAVNAALGAAVAARVEQLARPSEAERYRASVEQVTTITSLLLGLAGRLARTEAALAALSDRCPEEKALLTSKRDKLSSQLAEARQLEEGVRRRRQLVDACLERYLSRDELADHRLFVQTKAKLIRDARQIEDKIRSGEEQLAALSRAALRT